MFFFSSRRRHTRSLRDWSSDVCSSDLIVAPPRDGEAVVRGDLDIGQARRERGHVALAVLVAPPGDERRSEERRVGKECRSRWSPDHAKEKYGRGEVTRALAPDLWPEVE